MHKQVLFSLFFLHFACIHSFANGDETKCCGIQPLIEWPSERIPEGMNLEDAGQLQLYFGFPDFKTKAEHVVWQEAQPDVLLNDCGEGTIIRNFTTIDNGDPAYIPMYLEQRINLYTSKPCSGKATDGSPNTDYPQSDFLDNFPNPFSQQSTFRIQVEEAGERMFQVFDLHGRTALRQKIYLEEGLNHWDFSAGELPAGIYVLRITFKGQTRTHKFTIQ